MIQWLNIRWTLHGPTLNFIQYFLYTFSFFLVKIFWNTPDIFSSVYVYKYIEVKMLEYE